MVSDSVSLRTNQNLVKYEKDNSAISVASGDDTGSGFYDMVCDALLHPSENDIRTDSRPRHVAHFPYRHPTIVYASFPHRYGKGKHGARHHPKARLRPYRHRKGGNPAGAMAYGICHRYCPCLSSPCRLAAGSEKPAGGQEAYGEAKHHGEVVACRRLDISCGPHDAEVF